MTQRLCVVSVPAGHPYVARTLTHPDLTVLPDPSPEGAPDGQWWPPVVLSPGWISAHSADADLLHLHFGTESFSPAQLLSALHDAHAVGWPVVQTVHDLVHPQLTDQEPYVRQLDALVPGVDAVLTLTPGAAAEIENRWGRRARVMPHPRLFPEGATVPRGLVRDEVVIGTHLKDLRPNVDGPSTVAALIAAVDGLRAGGLPASGEVRLHRDVRDEAARDRVRAAIAASDSVVLLEHDRLDDRSLSNALAHVDVCVLPYRSGTHSGWLELCWDLGVPVAAPDVGYFSEQHDDPTVASFTLSASGAGVSLEACLRRLLQAGSRAGSDARQRLSTMRLARRAIDDRTTTQAHLDLYHELLSTAAVR
ncbi:hypothetical protein GCM10025867_31180 [Frondihabitans sucicola]|uniref:D-inositol 3-phosphate glycosyltransferase n=1 Tax=Frondihabitans sucicola TaxID=1268041 RepID=A0ABM8GQY4_9MICO|nr:hypothetical protein [Frondihabitans sucicola]BDZ50877.1 hypothetical protein GCM10025867_31180 [Frondihabitans sucicola]